MKIRIIMLVVLLTSTPALASDEQDVCAVVAGLAEVMMDLRQSGVPLQDLLAVKKPTKMTGEMISQAYKMPRYSTRRHQRQAVEDFRDSWYLDCYKASQLPPKGDAQ